MGGTLPFTLRRKRGKEYRMSQWTNWLPWAIDNMKLVNQHPGHTNTILKEWIAEMALPKKDRHWAYGSPHLAPYSYGLVVVDMQQNKILDCNHYHHFGQIHSVGLRNEFNSSHLDDGGGYTLGGDGPKTGLAAFLGDKENEAARFYDFYKAGRIKDVEQWDQDKDKWISIGQDINQWPIEKIIKEFIAVKNDDYVQFVLDMSPFEVIHFPETQQGWKDYRQTVIDLGFALSSKEEKMWSAKINNEDEDES